MFKVHGLNFSRNIGDLDIIIVKPNNVQEEYIHSLFDEDLHEYSYSNFKLNRDNFTLNILLVNKPKKEYHRLLYKYNNFEYNIVSINEIIDAKRQYGRMKDINDFKMLKNENFNI